MIDPVPSNIAEEELSRVIERPNGFYWLDEASGKEYGPYPTLLAALQDLQSAASEGEFEEGESLEEAEAEIGIGEWINPDTGEPAEETMPRFSDE